MSTHRNRIFAMIGGVTKAGTTSLYKYMEKHKDVCCSSLKETRFFLDESYPLSVQSRYQDAELQKYLDYFRSDREVFLEATPDYLYSLGTPERVSKALGVEQVRWIFLLRDPIERLISWHQFGKQVGQLDAELRLVDYVQSQLNGSANSDIQAFRALEQGNYSRYLQPYIDIFGESRVLILDFELLKKHPEDVARKVCQFLEISYDRFEELNFAQHNVSISVKSGKLQNFYYGFSELLYLRVYDKPLIRKTFHLLRNKIIEPIYRVVNVAASGEKEKLPPDLMATLREYYSDYYKEKR